MEDEEIAIEEHDLMDNPTVMRIFPNINVLKVELIDNNESNENALLKQTPIDDSEADKSRNHSSLKKRANVPLPWSTKKPVQDFNVKFLNNEYSNMIEEHQSDYCSYATNSKMKKYSTGEETEINLKVKKTIKIEQNCIKDTEPAFANYNVVKENTTKTCLKSKPLENSTFLKIPNELLKLKLNKTQNCSKNILPNPINQNKLPSSVLINVTSIVKPESNQIDTFSLAQHMMNDSEKNNKTYIEESFMAWKSNKIILGSKKIESKSQRPSTEDQGNFRKPLVRIENLASFLSKSRRFCKTCLILFPSNKRLVDHNSVRHSKLDGNLTNTNSNTLDMSYPKKAFKKYKCDICATLFAREYSLLRHKRNIHSLIIQSKKRKKIVKQDTKLHGKEEKEERQDFKCIHCNNNFKSHQAIIEHMYKVLQSKDITEFPDKVSLHIQDRNKKSPVSGKHDRMDTKMSKTVIRLEPPITPLQHNTNDSKKKLSETEVCYVGTEQQVKKSSFLLKTAFFKCIKCDVCFLSAKRAANHTQHNDPKLKWKCLKCLRMFLRDEQSSHTLQHSFGDKFDVFEIDDNAYFRVLYKCPNCATYFQEMDFFNHYSNCEVQSPNSAYCKFCHMLIDNKIKELHAMNHKNAGGKKLINILVESDLIASKEENVHNMEKNPQHNHLIGKKIRLLSEINLILDKEKIDHKTENKNSVDLNPETVVLSPTEKTKSILDDSLRFVYCGTCKCFIYVSKVRKLYNHTKAVCLPNASYVCKYCGLVLSEKTINSHRKLHQDYPGLTVNDFKFHDLHSGEEIRPPIPKYPNCHTCGIHFITKTAIISHECSDDYLMCPLCKIKLSSAAFPLHLSFHNYLPNAEFSRTLLKSTTNEVTPSVSKLMTCPEANKNRDNGHLLVYMCKICKVTVDAYDKVVEHCHEHLISQEKETVTKPCIACNLIFDVTCFDDHEKLHAYNKNKKFSILTYDAFYVTADDKIWLSHLFGSLSEKEINRIIGNSIYKFGRKIKLQILQDGLSHLTFYMCAKCKNMIDSSAIFEHCVMGILCYKSKAVPCTICKISLTSEQSRISHERIHEVEDITLKSYRIVIFNSIADKTVNRTLRLPRQYVLYECRNCNGIVDKKRFEHHTCDFEDLSKCSHCGLLLYSSDYLPHILKHREFCSYQDNNITVILLGLIKNCVKIKNRTKPSFCGVKLDYLVYRCRKCNVCFKDKQSSSTHVYRKNCAVTKCHICELYFEDNQFKYHEKLHEFDVYFSRENLAVVEFGSTCMEPIVTILEDEASLPKPNGFVKSKKLHNGSKLNDCCSDDTIIEKCDVIFRCICGLHFLNEVSAIAHYKAKKCINLRTSKQTCAKCGLSFEPSILYSHLLKHHGNKNICYYYNIIEMNETSIVL